MMQDGKYRGRAREWGLGLSGTGKEQLAVAFDFLDHPGTSMTAYLYFTDDTFDRTIRAMRDMGWKGVDLDNITDLDRNEVVLVVKAELNPKTNQMEPRIQWVNAAGGLALKTALDDGQKKTFAARMKGRILMADQSAGRAAASAPPGDRPPV